MLLHLMVCAFFCASAYAVEQEKVIRTSTYITYEDFLKWRDDKNTVILDASLLEKYFLVSPQLQRSSTNQDENITQEKLDKLLNSLIPTYDTKIILYCYQTFAPTRRVSASQSVSFSLMGNGYKNVYILEDLWKGNRSEQIAKTIGDKDVIPYAKKIPENIDMNK